MISSYPLFLLILLLLRKKKTVFRLRTATSKPDDNDSSSASSTIFALSSLENTESVATAHERDMVQWREIVTDQSFLQSTVSAIAPAEELKDGENAKPVSRTVDFGESSLGSNKKTASVIRPGKLNSKAKAMSAASFFGKQQKTAETATKKNSSTISTKKNSATEKKKVTAVNSKENRKNVIKKTQVAPVKIGNADDFVADEEDSDDDCDSKEEIRVVKKPAAARLPKESPPSPAPAPKPKKKASPVRGAMDAFAEEQSNAKRQRKRRKKLVEKTTMVGGYLRTETVTVWEDIPTDEENEEEEKKKQVLKTKAAVSSKPKKPENMKQKSLTGFFAPKKK